jgi:2-dehydro-3-deoxy-D-gluconate 5-dehydrogenase
MHNRIYDLFNLDGKVALVTGAGSGIGRGIAEGLALAGATIACADINAQIAEETAQKIRDCTGLLAYAVQVDVSDEARVRQVFQALDEQHGHLDILFNCAGIAHHETKLHEFACEEWERILAVNLNSVYYCCKAALPIMLRQGSGKIVNITSLLAERGSGSGGCPGMAATKAAVTILTKEMASAYASQGIQVNAIGAGMIKTNISKTLYPELTYEEVSDLFFKDDIQRIPMRRIGYPEDLQGAAIFLASSASDYVTGLVLWVDGGTSAV